MKKIGEMTLLELAACVATQLESCNIPVVLVGGSCVAIYATEQYTTKDLDFIELAYTRRSQLKEALASVGFTEHATGKYFTHPETDYFIEFPSGPLSIGGEPVPLLEEMATSTGTLKLLSPTDCIKDRLAAFYYWNDQQSLQQALAVARQCAFDLQAIRDWSAREGMQEKFSQFEGGLP